MSEGRCATVSRAILASTTRCMQYACVSAGGDGAGQPRRRCPYPWPHPLAPSPRPNAPPKRSSPPGGAGATRRHLELEVKCRRGLVHDRKLGLGVQQPRKADALLLAQGQRVLPHRDACDAAERRAPA
eukprot:7377963-Prymnesium_polylepis.2